MEKFIKMPPLGTRPMLPEDWQNIYIVQGMRESGWTDTQVADWIKASCDREEIVYLQALFRIYQYEAVDEKTKAQTDFSLANMALQQFMLPKQEQAAQAPQSRWQKFVGKLRKSS